MAKELKMGERASESMDRWLEGLSAIDIEHANLGAFFGGFVADHWWERGRADRKAFEATLKKRLKKRRLDCSPEFLDRAGEWFVEHMKAADERAKKTGDSRPK